MSSYILADFLGVNRICSCYSIPKIHYNDVLGAITRTAL